ncbi:MAG: vitamin B12-dependent ribonucleotide reductase [Planctomycetota bacterium]|jgi:ribonucleoside-diphosphate reductase alpha chain
MSELSPSTGVSPELKSEPKEQIPVVLTPNGQKVLERRYLKKDESGKLVETPEQMFRRVAHNIVQAELLYDRGADLQRIEDEMYEMMARLMFVPNSPTLMNAGRELQQLSACFVLPVDDSIDSIFEIIKNTAMIHKSGGGTGFSFCRIRPADDLVSTSHGRASGPVSFMRVFNEATEAINQGGFRRGANMAILRVDHPDIEEFIQCKGDEKSLNNFNISVGLTREFMEALEGKRNYLLVNPRSGAPVREISAQAVFSKIVDHAWRNGEPGIVFLDRLNAANPTPELGEIESTNPCGEQPLLPFESCNLGSINLSKMVARGKIDYAALRSVVHKAVRFLDDVIDMNRYPLPKIAEMTKANRKIGLGVMGFADLLIQLGIPYDSEKALAVGSEVMAFIDLESKEASRALAKIRGPFPNFEKSVFARAGDPPIRNATTTTIAPTGTISIIAGASSGIEPLFAVCFFRKVLDDDRLTEVNPLFEKLARKEGFYSKDLMAKIAEKGSLGGISEIPSEVKRLFPTAHELDPEWHVRMQAAFQAFTDNAVSKTVNFRNSATRKDVENAYRQAYSLKCKGVTVYRDGSRSVQVLNKGEARKEAAPEAPENTFHLKPRPRPMVMRGTTRKIRTGCGNLYVTINEDKQGEPFEIFSWMGKAGGCAASQTEAICRLISFALRSGADVVPIIGQLKGISCHSTAWGEGGKILSCADAIARAIEGYLKMREQEPLPPGAPPRRKTGPIHIRLSKKGACPDCGGIVDHDSGCVTCRVCGYSECS